jgi:uncharacterized protein YmfQ (DUF2313 family)
MIGRSTWLDYTGLLHRLLPRGWLWVRDGLTKFGALLDALGDELARVHNRALDMIEECDPQTATETLDAWERICGLPIPVGTAPVTDADRRTAIVAHLRTRGGCSPDYFEGVAAEHGITVTVEDRLHDAALHPDYSPAWAHYWIADCDASVVRRLRCGDRCSHPLVDYSDPDGLVLCYLFERYKPAHTKCIYNYEG